MKKLIVILVVLLGVAVVGRSLQSPKNTGDFDLVGFGKLPVLANGRIKPIDTIARSTLLQLQGRQRVSSPLIDEPFVSSPTEWLLDVAFRPEKADTYPTFAIDNLELLALLGKKEDDLKIRYDSTVKNVLSIIGFVPSHHRRFSYKEIEPYLRVIDEQVRLAQPIDQAVRTPFQRSVVQLYSNLLQYRRIQLTFIMPGRGDWLGELIKFQDTVGAGVDAFLAKQRGQAHDEAAVAALTELGDRFFAMSQTSNMHVVPADAGAEDAGAWKTVGEALLETFRTRRVSSTALAYAGFADAWVKNKPDQFNKLLELFRADLSKRYTPQLEKAAAESRFNAAEPFYTSMTVYGLAFFVALFSWLVWGEELRRAGFWLIALAWVVATAGIATRMFLEGRPPVTNLYSSALFVGWGAVGLCLILEAIFKNAVASVAAGAIGFATLLIAHHLSLSGDTLEMMQAVLDSNFWLATHVIIVTAGYSATFLAGFLAIIYVLRGVFTRTLDRGTADSLARMVYGIVCFATLASFVGTVLGGIWADQSWGRFWGWDPKENGALIIVMWNALILHARWGGWVKQRGLMNLAIVGNVVTSWSWFGTNMLGVGLHSYGFTDAAFVALSGFLGTQLLLLAVGCVPLRKWASPMVAVAKSAAIAEPIPAK